MSFGYIAFATSRGWRHQFLAMVNVSMNVEAIFFLFYWRELGLVPFFHGTLASLLHMDYLCLTIGTKNK